MTSADQPLYDIIFRGDILPGHQLFEVKDKLARLFKVDPTRINALFQGAAVPLKRNLDQATAQKYQAVLKQAGAAVQLTPAGKVQARPARAPATRVAAREVPTMTLQQRLAAEQTESERQEAAQAAEREASQAFTLAPVGADLLESAEKPEIAPVLVDISAMSLRSEGENLVDAAEHQRLEPVEVKVGDYGLSALGDDLLQAHEKIQPPPQTVKVLAVELAPVGSDLGQLKREVTALTPDISALRLA